MSQPLRTMNLSDESITILENFNGLINGIERDYAAVREAISEVNKEQEDLLHELELSPLAAHERSLVANKMIEVRLRRRQLLNDFAVIEPLIRFRKGHDSLLIPLAKMLRDMVKIKDAMGSRQYTPRIRTDIKLYRGKLAKGEAE